MILSNLGPTTPVNRAAAPTGGIPMAPTAAPGPQETVTLGSTPAAPEASNWTHQRGNNGVTQSTLKDQAGKTTQAVVATLAPGPLVPAGITFKWSAENPGAVTASLTDRPDVKLPQPSIADDGQIYLQIEPQGQGSNPAAPFLVYNPTTLAHGLSDGMRPDGQGGYVRGTQEYQNADGSFTIIANEHRTEAGTTYTRIDAGQQGLKAADVTEKPISKTAQAVEQYASWAVLGPLAMLMPKKENPGVKKSETPAEVQNTGQGLQVTHAASGSWNLPSLGQVGEKAGQIYDQASTSATSFNQNVSGKLGGSLKGMWDDIMGGGLLGKKGYNVGQGFFNKGAAAPPPPPAAPPQAPPAARISTVHPFTAVAPAALFPGLSAALAQ